eukprot:1139284-Pelagomonas_calceolata.AAC.4
MHLLHVKGFGGKSSLRQADVACSFRFLIMHNVSAQSFSIMFGSLGKSCGDGRARRWSLAKRLLAGESSMLWTTRYSQLTGLALSAFAGSQAIALDGPKLQGSDIRTARCCSRTLDVRATNELSFEDLDKLVPEDVASILEWLTEKVDALSTRLKAEPKESEEVGKALG